MGDCPNVEIRELLPERVAEHLAPRDAKRVDDHVAECEMCAFEVEVLRAARATLRARPTIDVKRVSGAVAAATRTPVRRERQRQQRPWLGWRAAASLALVAVGATSIAIWKGAHDGSRGADVVSQASETIAATTPSGTGRPGPGATAGSGSGSVTGQPTPTRALAVATAIPAASSGLTAAGGLSDLDDAELESLLGDISTLDASNFEEPQEVIPTIGGSEGVQ